MPARPQHVCVHACMRACLCVCVRACVCLCVRGRVARREGGRVFERRLDDGDGQARLPALATRLSWRWCRLWARVGHRGGPPPNGLLMLFSPCSSLPHLYCERRRMSDPVWPPMLVATPLLLSFPRPILAVPVGPLCDVVFPLCTFPPPPCPLSQRRDDAGLLAAFRAAFPTMNVAVVAEAPMKSAAGKALWRAFLEGPAKAISPDYAFGTLLRLDATGGYTAENTTLVSRGVFYAVEAARNAEGSHDGVDFEALA